MRSVILLRSRPGRPRWQLTTRPVTAVVLGVVSLAAAGAQLALLSTPTPWYQPAVAGFWAVVGLAFLGSAVGTRVRARRLAVARRRAPVDSLPFVPVPVRPARPRRRDVARDEEPGREDEPARELETGEPTDDLADAVRTAVNPVVAAAAPVLAAAPVPAATSVVPAAEPTERDTGGHRRSRSSERPTGLLNRHAVRAVRSVESVSRELPAVSPATPTVSPATSGPASRTVIPAPAAAKGPAPAAAERPIRPARAPAGDTPTPATGEGISRARRLPGLAGEPLGIRDGRVRPRPDANVGPRPDANVGPRHDGTVRPRGSREDAAPDGAVPSPRRAPEGTGPQRHVRASDPRPASTPAGGPITGDTGRAASSMTFGGGRSDAGRGSGLPAPTDTGRHAMIDPRDLPRPRDTGTASPSPARHAAPPVRDRVR